MTETRDRREQLPDESALDVVFRRGEWHSWADALEWLRTDGMDDSELTRDEATHLIDELECLERERVSFTRDSWLAAQVVHAHHGERC